MQKHIHFIGVCGVGMAGTAKLLKDLGHSVTGSDQGAYPPVSTYLESQGIDFATAYSPTNIPENVDYFVIGKNAKLTAEQNEEVAAAEAFGKPIKSFAEVIGEIVAERHNIVVTGSFGKSTTTSLVAWCLAHASKNPGYFIGAKPVDMETTSAIGAGDAPFVLEGDEYPSANFDDQSKFAHYHARDIILTSGTHDHVNIFPTQESYLAPFQKLLADQPPEGILVACLDGEHVSTLTTETKAHIVTYSFDNPEADYYSANHSFGATSSFDLLYHNTLIARVETSLLGTHNMQNIVGTATLLLERDLLTPAELTAAIKDFHGVVRRLERKNPDGSIPVYEGFGSSLSKARAAIEALKLHFPESPITVVFEPYEFSWRNRDSIEWYDTAFLGCEQVFVYKPASQGAGTHAQLSQEEIITRIKENGIHAEAIINAENELTKIMDSLKDNSVVLMISSGTIGGLIQSLPRSLS